MNAIAQTLAMLRTGPTRGWIVANVVAVQIGWFACVLGAAHGHPASGTLCAGVIVAWHLARVARPAVELRLIACAVLLGALFDTAMLAAGAVVYPDGQWFAWLTPHWMMALWAEFAISLNVSLRWLKQRGVLAAVLGAVAGPASFLAGMRLGAVRFVDPPVVLTLLAVGWAVAMPVLMGLSNRFDGVVPLASDQGQVR